MDIKTIKPADGLLVRFPDTRRLPVDGEPVEWSPYWQRRLTAGDVVEVPQGSIAETAPPAHVTTSSDAGDAGADRNPTRARRG